MTIGICAPWHSHYSGHVDFWQFVGSYWWLVFPLGGMIGGVAGGWAKAVRNWDERRRHHKLELAKIKVGNQIPAGAGDSTPQAQDAPVPNAPRAQEITTLWADHDEITSRWLDYELDVAKLIDFPVMSDMREPVTVDFHRAKRHADGLRPAEDEKPDADRLGEYRVAVRDLQVAFDIAEREARRRRAMDFPFEERRSLDRAKRLIALAEDSGATHAERQQAYRRAQRELEGLIAIPEGADEAISHRIAGALGAPSPAAPSEAPTSD